MGILSLIVQLGPVQSQVPFKVERGSGRRGQSDVL